MKHNDAKTREEIRQAMQTALQQDDKEGFAAAMNDMMACIGEDIKQDYEDKIEQLRQENDSRALTSRGVRQLTSQEKQYYQKLGEALLQSKAAMACWSAGGFLRATRPEQNFGFIEMTNC